MHEFESILHLQHIESRPLQRGIIEVVEIVESDDIAAFGQQLTRNMKPDETSGPRDQYGLFRHRIPEPAGSAAPAGRACLAVLVTLSQ
ncbi:MAG TPA: hypothetical protein VFW56_02505 [Bradyrhizobium sp.]|nr:hypothetical protein [Bradyrhizobium sp.]